MPSLYELGSEYMTLLATLEEAPEEEAEKYLTAFLESGEVAEKITNYCRLIRQLESDAAAVEQEIERLQQRKQHHEKLAERLRTGLLTFMTLTGRKRISTPQFNVSVSQGQPSVSVSINPEDLPPAFQRVKIVPDITAIKQSLLRDEPVEGCTLVRKQHITIR